MIKNQGFSANAIERKLMEPPVVALLVSSILATLDGYDRSPIDDKDRPLSPLD